MSEASYERSEYKSAGVRGGYFYYFFIKNILENIFYDYRSNLFQIFEDNNETINNICKSNTQKVNN